MLKNLMRGYLLIAVVAVAFAGERAQAQGLLNQDWVLDPSLSNVYMGTVKENAIFETHEFRSVEGIITKDGDASVRIDLASLDTHLDVRDVRMRFLMFETFKFPYADITAKLDKTKLQSLLTQTRMAYALKLTVNMHGVVQQIEAPVWVTRISDTTVSVATVKPIFITTDSFGLSKNLVRLTEVIGGLPIAKGASVTFDLVFGSGGLKSELEAARAAREKTRAAEATQVISAEGCETRFTVISQTGAIYFKTGSAELDKKESEPLLFSGADIANRCPSVRFEIEGHTDNVGTKPANQVLSEQRAKAVVDYLMSKGIAANRIKSSGFGDNRPVAANDTEVGRAKNRRIEFKVQKQ